MRSIPAILEENARRWTDRPAVVATHRGRDTALTFSELHAASEAFARVLAAGGIQPADPVLVLVPMSPDLYVSLLGIFRLGATAVILDPAAGPRHIAACCRRVPPAGLVAGIAVRCMRWLVPGLRTIPRVFAPGGEPPSGGPPLPGFPDSASAALITFTSGSTGEPKAAVRTQGFLVAQHRALEAAIALEPGERDLTTLPVFVLANLASGVTSILPDARISRPGRVKADRIARQAARWTPTRAAGSPAFFLRLLGRPEMLAGFQKIYTGGAPVFPSTLRALQSAAPRARVVAVYGSTEAEPIAHIACDEISEADWVAMKSGRGLLAGPPVPEIRLRLVPDQWGGPVMDFSPVAAESPGEILVAGDHVLQGYLGGVGDDETKCRVDGVVWHRTGDAGWMDHGGRLWLLGRCSARMGAGAGARYPFAVECIAMSFPAVRRAACVAHNGRNLLVLEGAESEQATADIRAAVAAAGTFAVLWTRRIPVDARHNAKVNYPKLRALLERMAR